jgi:hypothetical protein
VRGPSVLDSDVDLLLRLLAIEPLSRKELVDAMNEERPIRDSAVRVAVEEARARGVPLIVVGDSPRRYKIAETFEEYQAWRADHWSRIQRMLEQLRRMDETIERRFPEQLRLVA